MDSPAPIRMTTWIALVMTPLIVGFGGTFAFLHYTGAEAAPDQGFALIPPAPRSGNVIQPELLRIPALATPVIASEEELTTSTTSILQMGNTASTSQSSTDAVALATTTASADERKVQPDPKTEPAKPVSGFRLNVPYYKQLYTNSCEAASLRMALAYRGIFKTDIELISAMGYKPRPRDMVNNVWDDPQEMYVGEVDVVDITKGYGVYGKPVAKAARAFGRSADFTTAMTPVALAAEVKRGDPVIMWGYTSLGDPYLWTTPSGGTAKAFKGEHARLVVGFDGEASSPTGFYVHDPINGQQFEYWSTEALMNQFNAVPDVTNQAVVIR